MLLQGDSIETIDKINAREKLKSRERFREPYGFKPSSPPKHVFPGAYDGLFTPIRPLGVSACLPRDAIPPHPEPQVCVQGWVVLYLFVGCRFAVYVSLGVRDCFE